MGQRGHGVGGRHQAGGGPAESPPAPDEALVLLGFDPLLAAQAQLEGMTIVTRDPAIARYQVAILPA